MAGERTFVVKILGNADSAITAFKNLAREGQDAIEKVQKIGGGIGAAFDVVKKGAFVALGALTAVAGAATAAVIAAAADEASQKSLEAQLIRSAGATQAQVSATEAFIEKAMLATGVADDELRPAFGNLVRATNDLEKSQTLFSLALDISAATGRDLEDVTLGLGRAATGQIGALTRLGIPLDEGAKKSKDFGVILGTLQTQFGGASATAADTFSGRIKILKTSLGEVVEEIGYALLPTAERLVAFFQNRLLPALQAAVEGFKEKGLSGALKYFLAALGPFGVSVINTIEAVVLSVLTLGGHLDKVAAIVAGSLSVTNPVAALKIFGKILDDSGGAAEKAEIKFDELRNSIINTGNALNFANNKLSPLIDQTDRIGMKVMPKAKDATGDFASSLDDLKNSSGGATKTVETAKQKFEKYTDALKGSTSAQKAFTSAQKASVQAQQSLSDANTALTVAQENFTKAINGYGADSIEAKNAQRELGKAQRGVENSGYRVEESVFAVRDAERKLAEVRADPDSNPQMIREAEISLAQAKLAVSDATDSQTESTSLLSKAQQVLNEAISGAAVGSETYTKFLDLLNRAKEQQETASDRLTDALERETEAYENLADAIAKVAEAAKNTGRPNLSIPSLPGVPTPAGATGGGATGGGGGTQIVVNTGIGTNTIQAAREIVDLLQQYTLVDATAIQRLGFAPRR